MQTPKLEGTSQIWLKAFDALVKKSKSVMGVHISGHDVRGRVTSSLQGKMALSACMQEKDFITNGQREKYLDSKQM